MPPSKKTLANFRCPLCTKIGTTAIRRIPRLDINPVCNACHHKFARRLVRGESPSVIRDSLIAHSITRNEVPPKATTQLPLQQSFVKSPTTSKRSPAPSEQFDIERDLQNLQLLATNIRHVGQMNDSLRRLDTSDVTHAEYYNSSRLTLDSLAQHSETVRSLFSQFLRDACRHMRQASQSPPHPLSSSSEKLG